MKISDLFVRNIDRPVPPVIMAGQQDERNVLRELDEYVVTRELDREFRKLFEHYTASLDQPTERIGVWISGFFGSGKSHFLKILSYLFSNREVQGRRAVSFFDENKLNDEMLRATLEKAGRAAAGTDVILFNIDAKADSGSKSNKEAVARVMLKALDDHLGYLGSSPELAGFERLLDKRGKYAAFQAAFERESGQPWTELRDGWELEQHHITRALEAALGMDGDAADRLLDSVRNKSDVSAEEFAREVRDYLDRKGPQHRVLFLVDEVGQYVGDNSSLMLNLQSVTEELGAQAPGRAWILVTSQEDIDSVLSGKGRSNDFSKIQGRFSTQVKLSSANTDEVIRLRLLQKTEDGERALGALYDGVQAHLRNQLSFRNEVSMPGYRDAADFVATYPFVPYQFTVLQKVFEAIRNTGYSGKSLSEGERSMLNAFQEAARLASGRPLGALVPFHAFYGSVEGFLDSNVRRVIDQAQVNEGLDPGAGDIDLLRTLFMLKHVKEIRTNVDNLVTLSLTDIDDNKAVRKTATEASLERLERQTLVQKSGDTWVFLTNEEQDVGKEIKNVEVSEGELNSELQRRIWESTFMPKSLRYDAHRTFAFTRRVDGRSYGSAAGDIGLHIVTPYSEDFPQLSQSHLATLRSAARTGEGVEALLVLSDERSLFDELGTMVRTEKYVSRKTGQNNTPSMARILRERAEENAQRRVRIDTRLEGAIAQARVYALGAEHQPGSGKASEVLQNTLRLLVENGFQKLPYITRRHQTEADVARAFVTVDDAVTGEGESPNHLAESDMERWLNEQQGRSVRVTVTELLGRFTRMPYGWTVPETLGVLATLVARGRAELQVAQKPVDPGESGLAGRLMKKAGQDQTVVRVSDAIDLTALSVARRLAKEYLPANEQGAAEAPGLASAYQRQFAEDLRELGRFAEKAEQGYPFGPLLQAPHALLTELANVKGTAALIAAVRDREAELEAWTDLHDRVRNFYRGQQVKIFEELRSGLADLNADLGRVQDPALQERVERARAITAAVDPVRDIARMAGHLGPVAAHIEALLASAKEQVRGELEGKVARLREIAQELGAEETRKLTQPILDVRSRLERARTIDAVDSTLLGVREAATRVEQNIIAAINARAETGREGEEEEAERQAGNAGNAGGGLAAPTPDPVTPPAPRTRPIRTVRVKDVNTKTYLESGEDIEAFLSTLRAQLEQAVSSGERIRIE